MTAKILSFPEGRHIPNLSKEQKEPISKKIEQQQTKKYADAVADDIMIQMIGTLQHEGMNIGKIDENGQKTFLDVGIFMEAFRGLIYREMGLKHPFHYITDNMMYVEKSQGKKFSVIDYSGKEIVDKDEAIVEFESEVDNDINRLQPDSDK
tara:strand:+ start:221 stop:673 length:453 start_codon:yes stop_codon:yes gene_type:complete